MRVQWPEQVPVGILHAVNSNTDRSAYVHRQGGHMKADTLPDRLTSLFGSGSLCVCVFVCVSVCVFVCLCVYVCVCVCVRL